MEILFTKSKLIGSKLIRAVTKEPVSHCAIEHRGYVIHSNLRRGVHIQTVEEFKKVNTVVYSHRVKLPEDRILETLYRFLGAKYDYLAFITLGLRLLVPKFIPKANLWQATGMFLCTEFIAQYLYEQELLLTPGQLYNKIRR